MTLTLTPERETRLREQARRAGLPPEEYALRVLDGDEEAAPSPTEDAEDTDADPVEQVLRRYKTRNAAPVHQFLTGHPDVAPLLLEACPPIRRVFGEGTGVTLQVITDHESGSDTVLAARIQAVGTVAEALAKRKQFNREWWMRRPEAVTSPLQFDVELA